MSIELVRVGDEEGRRFSSDTWEHLLRLARLNGWRPAGTRQPLDWPAAEAWDRGDYFASKGQTVTAEDARAMAEALSRALQFQTAMSRRVIADFMAFCRYGWGFRIG